MIFVTVGTHDQDFDRLVRAADDLASMIEEVVLIQRGCGSYIPKRAQHIDWASSTRMEELVNQARVVIAQAGAGTIILSLSHKKPLVVVPRLPDFHEITDDHQLQIANALNDQSRAVIVLELTGAKLRDAIEKAIHNKETELDATKLIHAIKIQLREWESGEKSN